MKPAPQSRTTAAARPSGRRRTAALLGAGLVLGLLWSYGPTLAAVEDRWAHDPQYSHGYPRAGLRPARAVAAAEEFPGRAAAGVVGRGRAGGRGRPCGCAAATSISTGSRGFRSFCRCWRPASSSAAGGSACGSARPRPCCCSCSRCRSRRKRRWPGRLQQLATAVGTYALQTLGFAAVAEGNVIVVGDLRVGVVEACSGLGMLMAFFALSTTAALVVQPPDVERVVVFLSAAPIGVLMNLVRITATVYVFCDAGGGGGPRLLPRPGRLADDAAGLRRPLARTRPAGAAVRRRPAGAARAGPV